MYIIGGNLDVCYKIYKTQVVTDHLEKYESKVMCFWQWYTSLIYVTFVLHLSYLITQSYVLINWQQIVYSSRTLRTALKFRYCCNISLICHM